MSNNQMFDAVFSLFLWRFCCVFRRLIRYPRRNVRRFGRLGRGLVDGGSLVGPEFIGGQAVRRVGMGGRGGVMRARGAIPAYSLGQTKFLEKGVLV